MLPASTSASATLTAMTRLSSRPESCSPRWPLAHPRVPGGLFSPAEPLTRHRNAPHAPARPRTPPPRPAQPPPSRGIGRRPLPHPGTRRRRAGSRTPRSRVAAGEREDPSSYGEGPARPLKRVRPEGCGHAPGTEARFPGKDHTEDRTSGSCHASHPRAGSQFTHIRSCHRDPWDRHSEKCSPSEVGRKGQAHREMLRTGPVRASQALLQGRRQPL